MTTRWAFVAALSLALSLAADAAAAGTTPDYVFDTIDSYRVVGTVIYVTGVQHGQSAASSFTFSSYQGLVEPCERALIQAVNRPGRVTVSFYNTLVGASTSCEVKRNP
jgi:hypothetical protein